VTVPRSRTALAGLVAAALSAAVLPAATASASAGPAPALARSTPDRPAARVDPAVPTTGPAAVRLVVRTAPGTGPAPRDAVRRLGGTVTRDLPVVDGFAATLPARHVPALAATEGVAVVTADRGVQVQSGTWTSGGAELAPHVMRAPTAWGEGVTGSGVTVALLDTGVAESPDLAGRIVPVTDDRTGRTDSCHDLSGEDNCTDGYGHGTFMAGLIAGAGSGGSAPTGTAPEASILSVKVAGADGGADVSTVLAGLQWIVSFKDRYGIDVVNLSLGTDSTQSWEDDPLNYAVQRAWEAGIVVVVAAANTGPAPGTIAKPGDDPWVVTVGAVDSNGTPGIGDDRVPFFTSRGPTRHGVAKPDLVAPGARVVSLRAPGSFIDGEYPPADLDSPYRVGSGTSMATALVSGAAALALDATPGLLPDQVKHALVADARPVASDDTSVVGAGLVDAADTALTPAAGRANQGLGRARGHGSLDASRGSLSLEVEDAFGTLMTSRQTAQLVLWDPVGWTTGSWTPSTWYTSAHGSLGWNSARWAGSNWVGSNWVGSNWVGSNWVGSNWVGSSWYGAEDDRSYGRTGPGSASYGAWG